MMGDIAQNLIGVQEQIAAACSRRHRSETDVALVAVSKTRPAEAVLQAIDAGVRHFGENRVGEAEDKIPRVNAASQQPVVWHMIGHIQSRKARQIPALFDYVHSVDTLKLARKLSDAMQESDKKLRILLQINNSGEESKYGLNAVGWQSDAKVRDALWQTFAKIQALPCLDVCGLMTMAPFYQNKEETRPIFADLAALREALAAAFNIELPELSMGMSNDYTVAIEEGATIVRVGTAIFGQRD